MANDNLPRDPVELWQSQEVEPLLMPIEQIRAKSMKFEKCIRSRNLRETVAAIAVVVVFGFYLKWFPSPLERLGSCLTIAGLLLMVYFMNSKAAARRSPAGAAFETCLAFHRRELERHRDLLRSVWKWYLGPLVPGVSVFMVAVTATRIKHASDWWRAAPMLVLVAVLFWAAGWINHRAADKIQQRIDELDRVAGQQL
jgi:hypothetical protein